MKRKHTIAKSVISIVMSMMLFMTGTYANNQSVDAASTAQRTVDPEALDQWKDYFGVQSGHSQNVVLSTEYAGGVWTDKSVFEPNNLPKQLTDAKYQGQSISVTDKGDNFLVALSAMGSNKQIKSYSTIPTDTVLILDFSSSMRYTDDNGGSAVDELVEATNKAIADLLALNKNNRVAVVVYAGNTNKSFSEANGNVKIVLPLDSYTTPTAGAYLESKNVDRNPNYAMEVVPGVKNSSGTEVNANRFEVATGTFMQAGIYEAMKILLGAEPVVQEGVQRGTSRIPIMVLMTDGEPTLAHNDYNGNDSRSDLGKSNLSDYNGDTGEFTHRDTIAFVTSLTAAFAKKQVEAHYENNALMYTLPYGSAVLNRPEALSVLNPAQSSSVQNTLWNRFLNDETVRVFRSGSRNNYRYLSVQNSTVSTERLVAADRMYVDKYYPAQNDEEMLNAFEAIVEEIIIQSKYYPTYVEHDYDHDGYLTFVDKIGSYMEVSDVTGIVIGEHLYSGAALAARFPANQTGSIVVGNVLESDLISSVKLRLGITEDAVATALIQNAYDHGQMVYRSNTDFEHYIGWFSDADGDYVDFWHAGMTDAQINAAKAKGATHVIRSYIFLGDTDAVSGVSNTDMMYMSVRVARELATDKTVVTWRIPASLVPVMTYDVEVEVDSDGKITDVKDLELVEGSAEDPIRLLYEVQLNGQIKEWNIAEIVGENNKENGVYTFYSNKWAAEPGDTTANTYSHFEPSVQNERYYYVQDTLVLQKTGTDTYSAYKGEKPTGNGYYHEYQVFEKLENGTTRVHLHYEPISAVALEAAEQQGNEWMIPKGTIHRYYDYEFTAKDPNATETMAYNDHPFVHKEGDIYYTYSTLGNNGKLVVTPTTGFSLTKSLEDGFTSDATFTFQLSGQLSGATVVRVNENGMETAREALNANGQVSLGSGETVYVIGLSAGTYTVEELIPTGADYRVKQVKVSDQVVAGVTAAVELADQTIVPVEFVNGLQGKGDLVVSKDVTHPFDTVPEALAAKAFAITVDLNGEGVAGREFTAVHSSNQEITSIATDNDGKFTVSLKDGESITVKDLPEGTTYTITETLSNETDAGFTLNQNASLLSGVIAAETTVNGHVVNAYQPTSDVALNITATKTVLDEAGAFDWTGKSFQFKLQQYDPAESKYTQIELATIDKNGDSYQFQSLTFDKPGTYYYKVSEVIPTGEDRYPNMTYDATEGRLVVHVTDVNVDGKLEVSVKNYDTGAAIAAEGNVVSFTKDFVNEHVTQATYVEFTVDKDILDMNQVNPSPAGHLFGLYKVKDDGQVEATPTYMKRSEGAEGHATFHIPLNKVTEEHYVLKEIIPADADKIPGMIYDTSEYVVTVTATADNAGALEPHVSFAKGNMDVKEQELVFTNTLNLAPANMTFTVTKDMTGDETTPKTFEFLLQETDGSFHEAKADGVKEAKTITGEGTVSFSEITYTKAGTYYYSVSEVAGTIGGVTYDTTHYHITVTVSADGDALEAVEVINKQGGVAVNEMLFTNTYTRSGETSVTIEGTKTLTGRVMLNGEFTFRLEQVADANGTPMGQPLVLETQNGVATDGSAQFQFAPIPYNTLGTFYYKITEVPGATENGVTYSDASYVVEVNVTDNGEGGYASTWSVVGENSIVFANSYRPANVTLPFHAMKELTVKTLEENQFTFSMIETGSDFANAVSEGVNRTVQNDAQGAVDFGVVTYEESGIYYYVIREVVPADEDKIPGVTYDTSEYHVTVTIVDNEKGALESQTSIVLVKEDSEIPASSIAFRNEYTVTGSASVEISGTKTLTGKTLADDMFTFELHETDSTYATSDETAIAEQKNASGGYRFLLEYGASEIGQTYYYVVKEQYAGQTIEGIAYSSKEYPISVQILDDGEGKVEAVVTATGLMIAADTEDESKILVTGADFTNTYVAKPIDYTPQATKLYDGVMRSFTFILSGDDFETQEKQNNAEGEVVFDTLTFNEARTYEFTIVEKQNVLWDFIKWDTNEYKLTITVEDDGEGQLEVTEVNVTSTKGRDDLVFDNKYVREDGELVLTVKKILAGTSANPSGFSFGLYEDGNNTPIKTVVSAEDGVVSFEPIVYTNPGIHQYVVREILPVENGLTYHTKDGITYDTTAYRVDVAVTDNQEGDLVVTYRVDRKDVEESEYLFVFTNTYKTEKPEDPVPPTPPTPPTPSDVTEIESAKTGDGSMGRLWMVLLLISTMGLAGAWISVRKRRSAK